RPPGLLTPARGRFGKVGRRNRKDFLPRRVRAIMAVLARRLGDMLIDDGLITPIQRDEALRLQKANGGRFGANPVQLGAIELEALALAPSRQKGGPAAQPRRLRALHSEVVALV